MIHNSCGFRLLQYVRTIIVLFAHNFSENTLDRFAKINSSFSLPKVHLTNYLSIDNSCCTFKIWLLVVLINQIIIGSKVRHPMQLRRDVVSNLRRSLFGLTIFLPHPDRHMYGCNGKAMARLEHFSQYRSTWGGPLQGWISW